MRTRLIALVLGAALAAAHTFSAVAQTGNFLEPPKKLPGVARGDRTQNLDFLFGALKAAPDDTIAKAIEERIWAQWVISRSDTANLLMTRVRTAIEKQDTDLALTLLDAIVKIKPDYIEAWNRRATLHYMRKEYRQSMEDIRQVLIREPRHFGAMSGLGMILQEFGLRCRSDASTG